MKKSNLKIIIKNAMKIYNEHGFTRTGHNVYKSICQAIDKHYNRKHKK